LSRTLTDGGTTQALKTGKGWCQARPLSKGPERGEARFVQGSEKRGERPTGNPSVSRVWKMPKKVKLRVGQGAVPGPDPYTGQSCNGDQLGWTIRTS